MKELERGILESLQQVFALRSERKLRPELEDAVQQVKAFQHRRFVRTYDDLLSSPRYGAAARFFLEDLYSPADFSERDRQFARVVPALVKLFPNELVQTVSSLARLHALSERLDSALAAWWLRSSSGDVGPLQAPVYGAAWRAASLPSEREEQVARTLSIGSALERYTRSVMLRNSLRLMRGPAAAAGLGALQAFLERGFDTFRAMNGASTFLEIVGQRERALCQRLFDGDDSALAGTTGSTAPLP